MCSAAWVRAFGQQAAAFNKGDQKQPIRQLLGAAQWVGQCGAGQVAGVLPGLLYRAFAAAWDQRLKVAGFGPFSL